MPLDSRLPRRPRRPNGTLSTVCPLCGASKARQSDTCRKCWKDLRRPIDQPTDASYRLIPLSKGEHTLVDIEDYEWLNRWKWYALWSVHNQGFYAVRMTVDEEGKRHMVYMHREIMGLGLGDPEQTDHRFRRTLDNRRFIDNQDNLRIATSNENQRNRIRKRNSRTGYKGVCFNKQRRLYRADITVNNKQITLGFRRTAKAAHEDLYIPAAKKLHGKFARFE